MKKFLMLGVLMATVACVAQTEQDKLATDIVKFGTHSSQDERQTVKVNGCEMTTFVYSEIHYRKAYGKSVGWVLHSSFILDLSKVEDFGEDNYNEVQKNGIALLSPIPPYMMAHEKPEYRIEEYRNMLTGKLSIKGMQFSKKRDGEKYYVIPSDRGVILFSEVDDVTQIANFAKSLNEYKHTYCPIETQ